MMARRFTDEEIAAQLADAGYGPVLEDGTVWIDCSRCFGKGYLEWARHRANGVCFRCEGAKGRVYGARILAGRIRAQHARQVAAPAKARQRRLKAAADARAFMAEHPDLREALAGAGNDIRRDLARQLVQRGELTEKQIIFAQKLAKEATERATQRAAAEAALVEVPDTSERIAVEAEIAKVKEVEGYAYGTTALKALFICDAGEGRTFKLWGTLPQAFYGCDRGDRVRFHTKVERSRDDATFGFLKRPTRCEIVARAAA